MSLDLERFRAKWASQVNAALGASDYRANVSPYETASPTVPCVFLRRGQVAYHGTMGPPGHTTTGWEMVVRVAAQSDEDCHKAMDAYASTGNPASLVDAIDTDNTLGGTVGSLVVLSAERPEWFSPEGAREWLEMRLPMTLQQKGTT